MLARRKVLLTSDLYCWVFLAQSHKYLSLDRGEIKPTAFWLRWCLQHFSLIENQTLFGVWMRMLCCRRYGKWLRIRTACWTSSFVTGGASEMLLACSVATQHLERKSTALVQNLSYLLNLDKIFRYTTNMVVYLKVGSVTMLPY